MKELTIEQKAKAYDEAIEKAKQYWEVDTDNTMEVHAKGIMEYLFPELVEDELTWLTKYIEEEAYSLSMDIRDNEDRIKLKNLQRSLTWLEKQGESTDRVENIHTFLYGEPTDEEMKQLLQTEYEKGKADAIAEMQKDSGWNEEDLVIIERIEYDVTARKEHYENVNATECVQECKEELTWLKSLKERYIWEPSDEQLKVLDAIIYHKTVKLNNAESILISLLDDLKKLKE